MAIFPTSVFGLTIRPGTSYTTTIEEDTHITMASLVSKIPKDAARTSVVVSVNGTEFTLCSLTPNKHENQNLDIYLTEDEEVTFSVVGNCSIDLTGNIVTMIPPEGFDENGMDGMMEYGICF